MKKTRRTTEQIIRILRDSEGMMKPAGMRSRTAYHRLKAKYGGMGVKEAQR